MTPIPRKPAPPPLRRPVAVPAAPEPEEPDEPQEPVALVEEPERPPQVNTQERDWAEMAARCDAMLQQIDQMRSICLRALGRK